MLARSIPNIDAEGEMRAGFHGTAEPRPLPIASQCPISG
jgi:hypothetical protein